VLTGSVAEPLGAAFVAVSGNCAYTLAYSAGTVTVVNISNPAAPVVVGQSPYADSFPNASETQCSRSRTPLT
jgi:hypothetical protein